MAVVRPRLTGHPGYDVVLPREPTTTAEARFLVGVALSTWGLNDDASDRARLIASELVTNAVQHACGPVLRVVVERPAPDQVYLGVVDRAPHHLPHRRVPGTGATRGWGLVLVDAFADRWGCDRAGSSTRPRSKCVWARITAHP
ncbi:ATP-binding protein [Streptomyces sp. NPDC052095]|uniref:ATP-binding protein n=1 Tax=unclassified Streptomyces TaxID=2593676 RepID=UPI00344B8440